MLLVPGDTAEQQNSRTAETLNPNPLNKMPAVRIACVGRKRGGLQMLVGY